MQTHINIWENLCFVKISSMIHKFFMREKKEKRRKKVNWWNPFIEFHSIRNLLHIFRLHRSVICDIISNVVQATGNGNVVAAINLCHSFEIHPETTAQKKGFKYLLDLFFFVIERLISQFQTLRKILIKLNLIFFVIIPSEGQAKEQNWTNDTMFLFVIDWIRSQNIDKKWYFIRL